MQDIVNRKVNTKDEIVRRSFSVGEEIFVRDYRNNHDKWIFGVITEKIGTLTYEVLVNGVTWRRHIDQIRQIQHPLEEIVEKPSTVVDNSTIQQLDPTPVIATQQEPVIEPQQPADVQLPVECKQPKTPKVIKTKVKKPTTETVKAKVIVPAAVPVSDTVSDIPVIPVTRSGRQVRKPSKYDF